MTWSDLSQWHQAGELVPLCINRSPRTWSSSKVAASVHAIRFFPITMTSVQDIETKDNTDVYNVESIGRACEAPRQTTGRFSDDYTPWWQQSGLRRLYCLMPFLLLTQSTLGYDGSLLNGLQIMPSWQACKCLEVRYTWFQVANTRV